MIKEKIIKYRQKSGLQRNIKTIYIPQMNLEQLLEESFKKDPDNVRIVLGVLLGNGVINNHACRDYLLYQEYRELRASGMRVVDIYEELSERSCLRGTPIGAKRIEKIILQFKQRNKDLVNAG